MIPRYRLLAERLRVELVSLQELSERAESALLRARAQPADQDYFLAAAALDLHGFNVYTFNLRPDRVTELVDGLRPAFELARRDLLAFAGFLEQLSAADEG